MPYSPSQNGVAEQNNRSFVEVTQVMLINAKLTKQFWGEAMMCYVEIGNSHVTEHEIKERSHYLELRSSLFKISSFQFDSTFYLLSNWKVICPLCKLAMEREDSGIK